MKLKFIILASLLSIFLIALTSAVQQSTIYNFTGAFNNTFWLNKTASNGLSYITQTNNQIIQYLDCTAGGVCDSNLTTNTTLDLFYRGTNITIVYNLSNTGSFAYPTSYMKVDLLIGSTTINIFNYNPNTATFANQYVTLVRNGDGSTTYSSSGGSGGSSSATGNVSIRFHEHSEETNTYQTITIYSINATGSPQGNFLVNLTSPNDLSVFSTSSVNLTANYTVSGYNMTNATYFVWLPNSTLFNYTYFNVSGFETNSTVFQIDNLFPSSYLWNVYFCGNNNTDYVCGFAQNNLSFSVGATLSSILINNRSFETAYENFIASFNLISGSQVSLAKLVYNNVSYIITNVSQVGDVLTIQKQIDLPLNTNPNLNQTNVFYFQFTYAGSSVQSTSLNLQNASYIRLAHCDGTLGVSALNFTLKDEKTQSIINPLNNNTNFQTTFSYWIGSGTVVKNYSYSTLGNVSDVSFPFCIYPYPVTNGTFKSNMDSLFGASGYSDNEYHLRNATLTNITSNFDLFVYLLTQAQSTKFYITVKNGISFLDNTLVTVSKYFIGDGVYKNTGIKLTDDAGKFPLFADLDGKYRFYIVKDGVLLGTIDRTLTCASAPCTADINIQGDLSNAFEGYNSAYASNIVSSLEYNRTNKIVIYTFVDTTGMANYFRLIVSRNSVNDTSGATICDVYSYSSSGTLTCDVSAQDGDLFAKGFISRSPEKIDKILGFIVSDAVDRLGLMAIFLSMAIIITVVVAMAVITKGSPSGILFGLGASVFLLKLATLFPFSWPVVVSIEAVIIFIMIKVKQ